MIKAGEDALESLVDHRAIRAILHVLPADRILALVFSGGLGVGLKPKQSINFLLQHKNSLTFCKAATPSELLDMLVGLNPVLHVGLNLTHSEILCRRVRVCVCVRVCVRVCRYDCRREFENKKSILMSL